VNSESLGGSTAKSRVTQIFQFLQEFYSLRTKTVLQISDQPWTQWIRDIPSHECVWVASDSDLQISRALTVGTGGDANEEDDQADEINYDLLLSIRRPALKQAPEPPDVLTSWLEDGWDNPANSASYILEVQDSPDFLGEQTEDQVTIFFDDNPDRVSAWAEWIEIRNSWATTELPARNVNRIYERVFALHRELEREPETLELILGDGFLVCKNTRGEYVEHPILFQKVELRFDPLISQFELTQADSSPELYNALLQSIGVPPDVIRVAELDLNGGDIHPLTGESTNQFLERSVRSMSAGGEFVGDGRPVGRQDDIRVGREPVLFLRRRSGGFARAIENVLTDLETAEAVPESLNRIIGNFDNQQVQSEDNMDSSVQGTELEHLDLFLTKSATREQIDIATLLNRGGQVVVQGPPGTGKTHTIGNIIGHLLAQGKRVLVTSHTTKALEEVRDAVDEHLRPLCVSMLGGDRRHKSELQQAVDQITARLTQINEEELEREISYRSETRERMTGELRKIREQLVHAIGDEFRPIVCLGEEWKPIDAAKFVSNKVGVDDWIPDSPELNQSLPLSITEFETLYSTNASVPANYEADLESTLPNPDELTTPDDFSAKTSELSHLEEFDLDESRRFWNQENPLSQDYQYLLDIERKIKSATEVFLSNLEDSWQANLLLIGYRESLRKSSESTGLFSVWEGLINLVDQVSELREKFSASSLLYGPSILDHYLSDSGHRLLAEILDHLNSGKQLGGLSLLVHGNWKKLIKACLTNGNEPTTKEEFQSLKLLVELKIEEQRLKDRWARHMEDERFSELGISNQHDPIGRAIEHAVKIRNLIAWHGEQWVPMEKELADSGVDILQIKQTTASPAAIDDSDRFVLLKNLATDVLPRYIDEQQKRVKRESIISEMNRTLTVLSEGATNNNNDSIASQVADAVITRDADRYQKSYSLLRDAYSKRDAFELRTSLLSKLSSTAPKWSNSIRNREGIHGSATLPGTPNDGWIWAQLNSEIDRRLQESVPDLQDAANSMENQLQETTAELADAKAWLALKAHLTPNQLQALNGWRQLQSRIGKGTGIRAPSLRREARNLMPQCQSAVPVWIMPISTLVETFDPAVAEKFDCLIVDEASQVDVMGLIPWYMAKQVLVVGDDQQVTPEDVGAEQQPVDDLIRQFLKDIPSSALYDGRASIYELASVSFDKRVRLTDHFRCVEPIIDFSSQLCYDGDLNCLRDINDASVGPPTVEINVKGLKENDLNEREAVAIASLIISCIEQPEYSGLTFGMISMLGRSRQHQRVQELLMRHLDPKVFEERKILCGTPPHFQGGERDVMFISIVDSPNPNGGPLNRRGDGPRESFKKRFNVAASRAKDQMWVIHSLEPNYDLHGYNDDLRSRLITHARTASELPSKIELLKKRTRSPFEDEVAKILISAGYQVEAAWMVGKLEIDLVVTGGNGEKLAIECDGERYHPPEKLSEDLGRQRILQNWGWRFERIRGAAFYRNATSAMAPVFSRLENLNIHPRGESDDEPIHQDSHHQELRQRVEHRAGELLEDWENEGEIVTEQFVPFGTPQISSDYPVQMEIEESRMPAITSTVQAINHSESLLKRYTPTDLNGFQVGQNLQRAAAADILKMVVEVATIEGPVHRNIIFKRIREAYGLGKLIGSTREHVDAVISRGVRDRNIVRIDDFLCIEPSQFSNAPRIAGDRSINEISPRELTKAIDVARTVNPSLQPDELVKEVATQLGYSKVGSTIKRVLDGIVGSSD